MNSAAKLAPHPSDPAYVEWAAAQLSFLQNQLVQRTVELQQRDLKIQKLTLELAHHKRIRFGCKAEHWSPEQRDLFLESADEDGAAIVAEINVAAPPVARKKPTGRKPLPAELPRIDIRHEPESCTCGQCGRDLVKIGEDISEQLDVEPARFFVQRHIRPQYACRGCDTVTAAPVAPALIDGGLAAPGLHAWVLIQKYLDHLPLYRIEQISTRHGVPIARSTLAAWVGQLGVQLQPLVDRLSEQLKQRGVLHADETPVQQLDPGAGKTKRAYLWAYRSNDLDTGPPIVIFDYQTSRSGQHARAWLQDWRGHLMVDDYSGYKELFRQGVTELGCLAHARRKFFDLVSSGPHPVAQEALRLIAELYAVEAEGRELSIEGRLQLRERDAVPRLQELLEWLQIQRARTADGSGLARALDYSLKRWPAVIYPSTTIRWKTPSGRLPSAKRTGCSPAPSAPDSAPPPFKACSRQPNLMAWSRMRG